MTESWMRHGEFMQLLRIYRAGALTPTEALALLGDRATLADLEARGLLHTQGTLIGDLILVTAWAVQVAPDERWRYRSVSRSIDLAYERLALQALGWTVLVPAVRHGAREPGGLERYPRVRTDAGEAYVLAQLTHRGVASLTVRRLAKRFLHPLAGTGVRFVIISPSRKGLQAASANEAFMDFYVYRPDPGEGRARGRVKCLDDEVPGGDWGGRDPAPVVTSVGAAKLRAAGVAAFTVEVMQRPLPERMAAARRALACDGVITSAQLDRYFGLTDEDFRKVPYVEHLVNPVHGGDRLQVKVRFFLASLKLADLEADQLGHLAGTAEVRHLQGVPPEQCAVTSRSGGSGKLPDAVWSLDPADRTRRVAVEYDTGSYVKRTVRQKGESFYRQYDAVVWGVPTALRQGRVWSLLYRADRLTVVVAKWWA